MASNYVSNVAIVGVRHANTPNHDTTQVQNTNTRLNDRPVATVVVLWPKLS
jgi:hypothetical protein